MTKPTRVQNIVVVLQFDLVIVRAVEEDAVSEYAIIGEPPLLEGAT